MIYDLAALTLEELELLHGDLSLGSFLVLPKDMLVLICGRLTLQELGTLFSSSFSFSRFSSLLFCSLLFYVFSCLLFSFFPLGRLSMTSNLMDKVMYGCGVYLLISPTFCFSGFFSIFYLFPSPAPPDSSSSSFLIRWRNAFIAASPNPKTWKDRRSSFDWRGELKKLIKAGTVLIIAS